MEKSLKKADRTNSGHCTALLSRAVPVLLLLATLAGCSDPGPAVTAQAAGTTPAKAASRAADVPAISSTRQAVADLAQLCTPEATQAVASRLSIDVTVKPIANGHFPTATRFAAATDQVPAFCQVSGSYVTNPETGKTANFMATFPANWNGKYLQMGCSSHCGQFAVSDPAQPQTTITNQGYPYDPIIKGYASFATDQGHEGYAGGTWAIEGPGKVNEDAIEDFFYRASQILASMGKEFTEAFYAEAMKGPQSIAYSYFNGCSGGGRDAFVAASHFPEKFDGIIGGSAYLGSHFHSAGLTLATLRSEDAIVPPQLVSLIDPIVKAKCDGLDGVEDGLIQNPAACDFRPERDLPRCDGDAGEGQCFTQAQIETISVLLTAVTDEHGNIIEPGLSVSEIQARSFITPPRPEDLAARDPFPGSDTNDPTASNGSWPLADAFLKVFVHKNDPDFYTRDIVTFTKGGDGQVTGYRAVVPAEEVELLKREAHMATGRPEEARKLIDLDRKFLIWQNLSDELLTPYMSINYYKQLAKLHGGYEKLQDNVRLFNIPGSSHCSMGGVGPNSFDALAAIENWVEKGEAPDALPARLYPAGQYGFTDFSQSPSRTMPLCKFPEMARYSGQGDIDDATNWRCPAGDTGMLDIGEAGRQAGVIE